MLGRFWPVLLALLALALRCYSLSAPLLDYHSWRQADTAAIARNYAANGYRLLYPQIDWGGQTPGYVESEFPLYTFALALLYHMLGVHEWLGRLLSALSSAAAVAALALLVSAHSGRARAGLYAGVALMLMPFPIYFGRTLMPDSLMLLLGILAVGSLWRWRRCPSPGRFALALLCGISAPLAKTPNLLIVGVPLAYLWLAGRPWRARPRRWALALLYALGFGLPSLIWMWHAHGLARNPQFSFGIGEKLFDLDLLFDPQFYLLLAKWSVKDVLTWAGLPFLLLGGVVAAGWRMDAAPAGSGGWRLLPHAWLLGVLAFFLAGAGGVVGQDYYTLPLAAPAAWLIGIGIDYAQRALARWLAAAPARAALGTYVLPLLALGGLGELSLTRIAPLYETSDFYQTLGQRLDLALPAGERVGVIAPAVSEILYYSGRKGWRIDAAVIVPGGISSLPPDLGVRYLLIADPALSERRAQLEQELAAYRRIPIGPYALLLDLSQDGEQAPAQLVWETGHLIKGALLSYWQEAGAVERLGYPISDALPTAQGYQQFFDRALLLQQGDHVTRLPVGRLLLAAQGRAPEAAAVADLFQDAWQQAGGSQTLGAAISPLMPASRGRQVQIFEYGMLEQAADGEIGPGAAGRELLELRGLTEERQIELLRGW